MLSLAQIVGLVVGTVSALMLAGILTRLATGKLTRLQLGTHLAGAVGGLMIGTGFVLLPAAEYWRLAGPGVVLIAASSLLRIRFGFGK